MVIKATAKSAIEEMAHYISNHKQDWIYISTYGLWCGVSEKKQKHNKYCTTYKFTHYLNRYAERYGCNVDVLCGIDYGNHTMRKRLYKTQCEFRKIKFSKVMDCHAKYIVCSDGHAMIGSANLTESEWYDVSVFVDLNEEDFSKIIKSHENMKKTGVSAWRCK